jgi:hypothetical protein
MRKVPDREFRMESSGFRMVCSGCYLTMKEAKLKKSKATVK